MASAAHIGISFNGSRHRAAMAVRMAKTLSYAYLKSSKDFIS